MGFHKERRKIQLFCVVAAILFLGCFFPNLNVAARERESYTSVTIEFRDADTGEIFHTYVHPWQRVGKQYIYYMEEKLCQEGKGCYCYDELHEGTISEIDALSGNAEENRIVLYYKLYEMDKEDYVVNVIYKDADTDQTIRTERKNLGKFEVAVYGYGNWGYYSADMDYCILDGDNSYLYDTQNEKNVPILRVDSNPVKNNAILYYRRGKIKDGEAIVEVYYKYGHYTDANRDYLAKSYIAGQTVGDSYVCQDENVLWAHKKYIYYPEEAREQFYFNETESSLSIDTLSQNSKENVIIIQHDEYMELTGMNPVYKYANFKIQYIEEDTGRVLAESDETVKREGIFYYRPQQIFQADNGVKYYLDNTKAENMLQIDTENSYPAYGYSSCREQVTAYYRPVRQSGDPAGVYVNFLDSSTGQLLRIEVISNVSVGNAYSHKPKKTFIINDKLYTFDEKNTKNVLNLQTISGHPDIDELDVYYIAKEIKDDQPNQQVSPEQLIRQVSLNKPIRLSGNKVKLKWKKVSGAKGYQVVYATNSKFKKATKKTTAKITLTMKKLKKGKTYYVKVRAYKLDSTGNKVYGKYSKVKKVTVK